MIAARQLHCLFRRLSSNDLKVTSVCQVSNNKVKSNCVALCERNDAGCVRLVFKTDAFFL